MRTPESVGYDRRKRPRRSGRSLNSLFASVAGCLQTSDGQKFPDEVASVRSWSPVVGWIFMTNFMTSAETVKKSFVIN